MTERSLAPAPGPPWSLVVAATVSVQLASALWGWSTRTGAPGTAGFVGLMRDSACMPDFSSEACFFPGLTGEPEGPAAWAAPAAGRVALSPD